MRSTDYISKGTAVARLYKAREYLLMDKDCRIKIVGRAYAFT